MQCGNICPNDRQPFPEVASLPRNFVLLQLIAQDATAALPRRPSRNWSWAGLAALGAVAIALLAWGIGSRFVVPVAERVPPEGLGRRIFNAASKGDAAVLRPLVKGWGGNDVLNWADPDNYGRTPLVVGSTEGKLEAVRLLLAAPGELMLPIHQ